jgi:ketol-acid reductoisomerase
MGEVLEDIKNGSFAQRFIDDQDNGAKEFKAFRERPRHTRSRRSARTSAA